MRHERTWTWFVREPLVGFAVIGLTLFGLSSSGRDRAREPAARSEAPAERAPIVVDARVRDDIRARAERRLGRIASEAEIDGETERWIDEEVLYREGLARGLHRFDPMIRERVASRMGYVLEDMVVVPEPTEAELRAWFAAHRDRWAVPDRIDFTHVFVDGDGADARARAERLADALAAGAPPDRLGDRFPGGRRYRGRRSADLARAFGAAFAAGLDEQPPGAWVARRSRYGWHAVRVDRAEPGRPANFASARLDVAKAWRDARRDADRRAALARMRAEWEIVLR